MYDHIPSSRRAAYQVALASQHWAGLRVGVIKKRKRCQRCGSRCFLELHHLHYETLGAETEQDVELVCKECHEAADKERAFLSWARKKAGPFVRTISPALRQQFEEWWSAR